MPEFLDKCLIYHPSGKAHQLNARGITIMNSRVDWYAETSSLITASFGKVRNGPAVYLVVEAIQGGGWDWTAWTANRPRSSLKGKSESKAGAMRKAENVARILLLTRVLQGSDKTMSSKYVDGSRRL